MQALELPVQTDDGHRWNLLARIPDDPVASLLWLPALGVATRHYLPLAEALATRGIAVFLHEWRGHGSSNRRAGNKCDWGYRELLDSDLPASEAALMKLVATGLPAIIGGHSLGGQLASCRIAMTPDVKRQLWLVASGAPYWRAFPPPTRWWLPLAYRFLPWLADRCGALPGRRIGFGGLEARGVIADWSRSALSGRYAACGLDIDLETALAISTPRIRAVVLTHDWLAPCTSLRFLLSKMPQADATVDKLGEQALGVAADHFQWMKQPGAVASALLD
ncbi:MULTISPECIES: alpha/beta hydrolase family protein [unclassified Lysobacter]